MIKLLNPGFYGASLTGVWLDDLELGGVVSTRLEIDLGKVEKILITNSTRNHDKSVLFGYNYNGWREPIHPEIVKLMAAQPTKPVHSHEPWKQSFKRQSRQVRKPK